MVGRIAALARRLGAGLSRAMSENASVDPGSYPPLPQGLRIYAVGDLHGRSDLLAKLHRCIDAETQPAQGALEVYLGDYLDRGHDSRGVLDALISRRKEGRRCAFLRGNHEAALDLVLEGSLDLESWRAIGGFETALSYGVDPRRLAAAGPAAGEILAQAVPPSHRRFVRTLRQSYRFGRYFFAHAGVRPGVPLDRQSAEDLLWIREPFLSASDDFGAIVVHGHTPNAEPELRANRINLDTGAFATGRLTCLRIDEGGARLLEIRN